MNKLNLINLNNERITIKPADDINWDSIDYCWTEIEAYFIDKDYHLCIGQETGGAFFHQFIKTLHKAINKNLQLNNSITENLGIMNNEYAHEIVYSNYIDESRFTMIPTYNTKETYWVGLNYHLCSTYNTSNPMVNTWLYNDEHNNIILEITPYYKWSFFPSDPKNPEFITYEEFMKNYKPLVTRTIPHEITQKWLEQVTQAYRQLFDTQEDFDKEMKLLDQ